MSDFHGSARKRPGLETLEDRGVPATLAPLASLFNHHSAAPLSIATTGTPQGPVYNLGSQGATTTATTPGTPVAVTTPAPPTTSTEASFSSALVGQQRTATIQKFNRSLGTLTSVEIIAEGAISAEAKVENLSARPGTAMAELNGSLSFKVNGMANAVTATIAKTESGTVTAFDGTADLAGTSSKTFNAQATASFQTVTLSDSASLALFSGNGSGTLQVIQDADAETCVCGPGNLIGAVQTEASGKIRVVYHYTPTAEVGSISGFVYHDVNRNGAFGAGDLRLRGVLISLTGTNIYGAAVSRTGVTNANGVFSFTGLTAGTYTLTETQPTSYRQGVNRVGSHSGTVNGDTITTINLPAGERARNYNFGEIKVAPRPVVTPPPRPPLVGKWAFIGHAWM